MTKNNRDDYRDITNLCQEICILSGKFLSACIKSAMEAEYGDRAYKVLQELDAERVALLHSNGEPALPILLHSSSFDELGMKDSAKVLNYLPKVQDLMCKRFGLDEWQCGMAQYLARSLALLRNTVAHAAE